MVSGGGHRISHGGIAALTSAKEQHLIEIFEEPVIHEPVEIAIKSLIAIPAFALGQDAQMRPAVGAHHVKTALFAVGSGVNLAKLFKGNDQPRAGLVEDCRVVTAERLEIPVFLGGFFNSLILVVPIKIDKLGVECAVYIFHRLALGPHPLTRIGVSWHFAAKMGLTQT